MLFRARRPSPVRDPWKPAIIQPLPNCFQDATGGFRIFGQTPRSESYSSQGAQVLGGDGWAGEIAEGVAELAGKNLSHLCGPKLGRITRPDLVQKPDELLVMPVKGGCPLGCLGEAVVVQRSEALRGIF